MATKTVKVSSKKKKSKTEVFLEVFGLFAPFILKAIDRKGSESIPTLISIKSDEGVGSVSASVPDSDGNQSVTKFTVG